MIFTSGKAKTGIVPTSLDSTSVSKPAAARICTIFATEKAKPAKHVLNRKVPAAAAHDNDFYEQTSEKQYTLSLKRLTGSCCSRDTIFTTGEAKTGRWYTPGFIFWVEKQVPTTGQASDIY